MLLLESSFSNAFKKKKQFTTIGKNMDFTGLFFCRQNMFTKPAVCFDHLPWPVLTQPFSSQTPFLFQAFGPVRPLEAWGSSGLDPIPRVIRVCAAVTIQGRLSHLLVSMTLGCLPTNHAGPSGLLLVETLPRNWSFLARLDRESEMDTGKAILETLSWTTES